MLMLWLMQALFCDEVIANFPLYSIAFCIRTPLYSFILVTEWPSQYSMTRRKIDSNFSFVSYYIFLSLIKRSPLLQNGVAEIFKDVAFKKVTETDLHACIRNPHKKNGSAFNSFEFEYCHLRKHIVGRQKINYGKAKTTFFLFLP